MHVKKVSFDYIDKAELLIRPLMRSFRRFSLGVIAGILLVKTVFAMSVESSEERTNSIPHLVTSVKIKLNRFNNYEGMLSLKSPELLGAISQPDEFLLFFRKMTDSVLRAHPDVEDAQLMRVNNTVVILPLLKGNELTPVSKSEPALAPASAETGTRVIYVAIIPDKNGLDRYRVTPASQELLVHLTEHLNHLSDSRTDEAREALMRAFDLSQVKSKIGLVPVRIGTYAVPSSKKEKLKKKLARSFRKILNRHLAEYRLSETDWSLEHRLQNYINQTVLWENEHFLKFVLFFVVGLSAAYFSPYLLLLWVLLLTQLFPILFQRYNRRRAERILRRIER